MRIKRLSCFGDSTRSYRHIIRMSGDHDLIEAALRHFADGDEASWADEREIQAALDYVAGNAVVLEFPPDYYLPARVNHFNYIVDRRCADDAGMARVVFDAAWKEQAAISLLAVFHADLAIDAVIIGSKKRELLAFSSTAKHPGTWRAGDSIDLPAAALDEHENTWKPKTSIRKPFQNTGFQPKGVPAASIAVTGSFANLDLVRFDILNGRVPVETAYFEEFEGDRQVVRLRNPQAACALAKQWSAHSTSCEFESMVTQPNGERRSIRHVGGVAVAQFDDFASPQQLQETSRSRRFHSSEVSA